MKFPIEDDARIHFAQMHGEVSCSECHMVCVGTEGLKGHVRAFHQQQKQNSVLQSHSATAVHGFHHQQQLTQQAPSTSQVPGTNPITPRLRAPEKPEKPLSAYCRFTKKFYGSVKMENPELKLFEIGSIMGQKWRRLKPDEKKEYQDAWKADMGRFTYDVRRE